MADNSIWGWSTTAASNSNTADSTAGMEEGIFAANVNNRYRGGLARIASFLKTLFGSATNGGSSDAYTITSPSGHALTAYADGQAFGFKANHTNTTTTPTLNVDGLGAKTIVTQGGGALIPGQLITGCRYQVVYDSTAGNLRLLGGLGNATTSVAQTWSAAQAFSSGVTFGDANFSAAISGSDPHFTLDSTDYVSYDRANNRLEAYIGGTRALRLTASALELASGVTVWTSANDGAGTGLDADTVDGVQLAALAQLVGATFTGNIVVSAGSNYYARPTSGGASGYVWLDFGGNQRFVLGRDDTVGNLYLNRYNSSGVYVDTPLNIPINGGGGPQVLGGTLWHSANDGAGSGLDADTVDGLEASALLLAANVASAANIRANTADKIIDTDAAWSSLAEVTLTDAATIAVDMSTFINAVVTLGGNRTLGQPSNVKVGQSGHIRVVQDATGGRTLGYHADYEFANGTAPTVAASANDQSLLFYKVLASNRIFVSAALDIS